MHLKDLLPSLDIGAVEGHLSVETPGAEQGRIKNFRSVGRGHDDNTLVCVEAVHLHQQLVQGLLTFIMSAHRVQPTSLSERIQLVDKDDAWGLFLSLGKEVTHASRPDPYEHLDKIRSAHAEEWDPRLAGYGLGQQCLPGSRGPDDQDPFWNLSSKAAVPLRRLQKFDDLHQLRARLVDPCHIGEGHAGLFLHVDLGLTFADRHQTARRSSNPLHKKHPHTNEHQGREYP